MNVVNNFKTTLSANVTNSQNTLILTSLLTNDKVPHTIVMSDLGAAGYLVLEPKTANEELIKFTGISGNTLTGVVRGLAYYGDSEVSIPANAKAHQSGTPVIMSNVSYIYQKYVSKDANETVDGIKTFNSVPKLAPTRVINDNRQVVDKEYADSIAASGITSFLVTDAGGININIGTGYYSLNGNTDFYTGAAAVVLTDDATNYVEFLDGAVSINVIGFSDDAISLAKVITTSGDITSLVDARTFITVTDLKTNGGLKRDASGLSVELGNGLEMVTNAVSVKVKTNSGILVDANGVSVDSGITANKVIQLDSNAKLPAVDGSQLVNLQVLYQQFIDNPAITGGSLTFDMRDLKVDTNGDVYVLITETSQDRYSFLSKFTKDTTTGQYSLVWTLNEDGGSGGIGMYSFAILGDYVYYVKGNNQDIKRADKSTGTNTISMTCSGFTPYIYNKAIVSDGTYLYLMNITGSYVIYKISIYGTTATSISSVASVYVHWSLSFVKDGYAYICDGTQNIKINLSTGFSSVWNSGIKKIKVGGASLVPAYNGTLFGTNTLLTLTLNRDSAGPTNGVISYTTISSF